MSTPTDLPPKLESPSTDSGASAAPSAAPSAAAADTIVTRFCLGRKRKARKVPLLVANDDEWRALVTKSLPELADKDSWHCEYDDGAWIEGAEDWNLIAEDWMARPEAERREAGGGKHLVLTVVLDIDACDKCESCDCRGQKSYYNASLHGAIAPGTVIPETPVAGFVAPHAAGAPSGGAQPMSDDSSSSKKRKALTALPPPLTDEQSEAMDKEDPNANASGSASGSASAGGGAAKVKKQRTGADGGWQSGAAAEPGWQNGRGRGGARGRGRGRGGGGGGWQTTPQGGAGGWQGGGAAAAAGYGAGGYGAGAPYGGAGGYGGGFQQQRGGRGRGRGGFQQRGGRGGGFQQRGRGRGGFQQRGGRGGGFGGGNMSHEQQSQAMRAQMLDIMRSTGQPMSMLWIRKQLGSGFGAEKPKTKTVNWHLYQLQDAGVVQRVENGTTKPDWVLLQ